MLIASPRPQTCVVLIVCLLTHRAPPDSALGKAPSPTPLDALRAKVVQNEAATRLIKMSYSVRYDRPAVEKAAAVGAPVGRPGRQGGKPYGREEGVWPRGGERHHLSVNSYTEDSHRPARSDTHVLDAMAVKWLSRTPPFQGIISPLRTFIWGQIAP